MPRIAAPVLPAAVVLGALLLVGRPPAAAQGISGVTRRTPALEKQATARSFFDAAGIPTAGAGVTSGGAPATATATTPLQGTLFAVTPPRTPGAPRTAAPALARALASPPPTPARTPVVPRVNLPPVHQRPFLVPAVPAGIARPVTNRSINPSPYHVAPSVPSRTP